MNAQTLKSTTSLAPAVSSSPVRLQRRCGCGTHTPAGGSCQSCAKTASGDEAENAEGQRAPASVGQVIGSGGRPMDPDVRRDMEAGFGRDFSQVRVHQSAEAERSASEIAATAYTVGNHIVFGKDAYAPDSREGRQTLAHELTHVVQQQGASMPDPGSLEITPANDATEHEADAISQAIAGGGTAGQAGQGGIAVARQPAGPAAPPAGPAAPPAAPALPSVSLGNFRNSGNTNAENTCPLCPQTLGVAASAGTNVMEMRGDITGHVAGAQYDIKRTKERGTWKKVGGAWSQLSHVGPGADDDSHNDDEMLTPVNSHIYVMDTPGFNSFADPVGDASATEAVYKASFIETCNVKVGTGAWTQSSNSVAWHSITWMEKSGGSWRRKAGSSEITTGATAVGTGDP